MNNPRFDNAFMMFVLSQGSINPGAPCSRHWLALTGISSAFYDPGS